MVVGRARDHRDFAERYSIGEEVVEQEAVDDPSAEVLDACLVDLCVGDCTLRVRLIQASICERLMVSALDFCI